MFDIKINKIKKLETMHRKLNFILVVFLVSLVNVSTSLEFKISYIHSQIENGQKNCSDLMIEFMKRSSKYNSDLNAIINFNGKVLVQAKILDDYFFQNGRKLKGKLHCIPIGVKDNVDIVEMPTTGGIVALRNSRPNKDASSMKRLRDEGAIFVFKTNLGELAFQSDSSELGGICHNPFDFKRACGGSSSGSAVSVTTGLALIAIGTDTSGSNLAPSSFNGIYGLRL